VESVSRRLTARRQRWPSGVNIQPFSDARGEAEILLRGGTEFDVLSNEVGPDGVRQLIVREVR
jgi:hypothetical protein